MLSLVRHVWCTIRYTTEKLYKMGLQPHTAFGCAMQFLMQPTPDVKELFSAEAAALADPDALKIGIQMRYAAAGLCL